MENKIVYLKTYIITIVVLVILSAAAIGGMFYYYENKVDELERMLNSSKNPSDITIVPDMDTSVDNVIAK